LVLLTNEQKTGMFRFLPLFRFRLQIGASKRSAFEQTPIPDDKLLPISLPAVIFSIIGWGNAVFFCLLNPQLFKNNQRIFFHFGKGKPFFAQVFQRSTNVIDFSFVNQ
jgi:hypothetical protein